MTCDSWSLFIPEMLSASKLDVEQLLFKLTMKANSEAACALLAPSESNCKAIMDFVSFEDSL